MKANILLLDLETAPKLAYVWRFWQEDVAPKQVVGHGSMMSFACKWLGRNEIFYEENREDNEYDLLIRLFSYLDDADIVIAHNGDKFDLPQIRSRFLVNNILPPSPFKIIDTYKTAKKEFGFPSNSLEYLALVLGCEVKKDNHKNFPGFILWKECLLGNPLAWDEMKEYNINDVIVLEELYYKLRPYISNHPIISAFAEPEVPMCVKCSSTNIERRGFSYLVSGSYQRYCCKDCGGWSRSRYSSSKKNENILNNAVQ